MPQILFGPCNHRSFLTWAYYMPMIFNHSVRAAHSLVLDRSYPYIKWRSRYFLVIYSPLLCPLDCIPCHGLCYRISLRAQNDQRKFSEEAELLSTYQLWLVHKSVIERRCLQKNKPNITFRHNSIRNLGLHWYKVLKSFQNFPQKWGSNQSLDRRHTGIITYYIPMVLTN